eukprot:Seg223.6 transcript_id=Seg223.6/GoldUCD/mRNA.D3Y31 product="Breast cancer anti-estrogen resistance protein 1" protein_id=Seg223.6/GoldUCD/D3Y31
MTLLAKALYDNLADAPDELSFRKGDIVTVIEQDVDGLVGWFLCLLHGRQGIAPGNRLQLLTSFDGGEAFDNSGSQGSLSNEEISDSFDFADGGNHHGSEYDHLPPPVKASHGQVYDSPSPRTLKDVYTSDGRTAFLNYSFPTKPNSSVASNTPNYATPSKFDQGKHSSTPVSHPNYSTPTQFKGSQSDYDVIPNRTGVNKAGNPLNMKPAELYNFPDPTSKFSIPEDLYDVPTRRPTIVQKSSTPNSPRPEFQNVLSAFTAIPDDEKPASALDPKGTPFFGGEGLYDIPRMAKGKSQDMLYDTPTNMFQKAGSANDLYDVPSNASKGISKGNKAASTEELYDQLPVRKNLPNYSNIQPPVRRDSSKQIKPVVENTGHEIYDVPNSEMEQLYDVPPPNIAPRETQAPSQEIYDIPPRTTSKNARNSENININIKSSFNKDNPIIPQDEIYDQVPARRNSNKMPETVDSIYDTPSGNSHVETEQIYDKPPRKIDANGNSTQPACDLSQRKDEISDAVPPMQEIYDIPKKQEEDTIYDQLPPQRGMPPQRSAPSQESLYDTLPERGSYQHDDMYSTPAHEADSLYDVPTHHDINKVMSDITPFRTSNQSLMKPYSRHQRAAAGVMAPTTHGKAPNYDEDDYVDYQDIYGKEAPSEIVKEMEKPAESSPRASPTKLLRKNSSFDQINMSAVKELKLTQQQAYDRLNKLHLAVDTSVTTLMSYSSGDWLDPVHLSHNIDQIKDMANKSKLAMRLLTEFGLGMVVNSRTMNEELDAEKMKTDIEPMLEYYYKIKVCILHLDGCRWSVPAVRDKDNEKFFATLNAIMILGGRVPETCRKLTSTLYYSVRSLFKPEEPAKAVQSRDDAKSITERMEELKMKSQSNRVADNASNAEKGKLRQLSGTVDAKKVREILELDTQPKPNWHDHEELSAEKANGADMSPMEMKQEFQSRRQKGYNSTLPRRPPVPPKPSLPTNRRSMAAFVSDEQPTSPSVQKADTLVTDFIADDGRKKYASDPTQSPMEREPTRKPEWGGSCPQLDDHSTYSTPPSHSMERATSSGTAASTTSTASLNNSSDDLDGNANLNKMPSDTNLYSQTMQQSRVTEPPAPTHIRSASLPWNDNKIPFSSYEKESGNAQQVNANKRLSRLDHRDSEALTFFLQRVESQVLILRDAVRNLTESVSNSEAPQVFVSHAKFVILTAHKVVHAGEELCGKLLNDEVKTKVKRATTRLADSIRGVVAGTKQAALDYPNQNSLMEMMTTVLSVGESVREVHKEAKQALEL